MRGIRAPRRRDGASKADPYFDVVKEHWEAIVHVFQQFADKNPVLLFDVQEGRIYAYPFEGFAAELSAKDRPGAAAQHAKVVAGKTILVFVRDNVQRRLVSYSVDRGGA